MESKPDLVPERRSGSSGPEGFCRRDESGLTVRVRNQANPDVLQETTTVVVFSGVTKTAQTAPMPGGSQVDVTVEIPAGCFDPDCSFEITVDSNDAVEEANEANNTEAGICIG